MSEISRVTEILDISTHDLDKITGRKFILPSNVTNLQRHIYEALNIKFSQTKLIGEDKN